MCRGCWLNVAWTWTKFWNLALMSYRQYAFLDPDGSLMFPVGDVGATWLV